MESINTIVVPQGAEYQAVCRGLAKAKIKNIEVIGIPIGIRQIDRVLSDYGEVIGKARGIVIMGLCGSLVDLHRIGDSVLVKICTDLARNRVEFDQDLIAQMEHKLSIGVVAALTSDRIITQAPEKFTLAQQYSSSIVEMEGYGYAKELQHRNIPVAMIRVVSDDPHSDLPDLNQAVDSQGNLKNLPMAIALLKQPIAATRLIKGSLAGLQALEQITMKLFSPI